MRLELVPIPVVDVDRAKTFYVDDVGFGVDHDVSPADGVRVVQLTPSSDAPSSPASADGAPGGLVTSGSLALSVDVEVGQEIEPVIHGANPIQPHCTAC